MRAETHTLAAARRRAVAAQTPPHSLRSDSRKHPHPSLLPSKCLISGLQLHAIRSLAADSGHIHHTETSRGHIHHITVPSRCCIHHFTLTNRITFTSHWQGDVNPFSTVPSRGYLPHATMVNSIYIHNFTVANRRFIHHSIMAGRRLKDTPPCQVDVIYITLQGQDGFASIALPQTGRSGGAVAITRSQLVGKWQRAAGRLRRSRGERAAMGPPQERNDAPSLHAHPLRER